MKDAERPLHVRVAEALGWTRLHVIGIDWASDVIVKPTNFENPYWAGKSPISQEELERYVAAELRRGDILLPYQTGPHGPTSPIPHYDTDWSATGPLIEKYCFYISRFHGLVEWHVPKDWIASCCERKETNKKNPILGEGETPLIAICNLIIALHEKGKL